PGAGGRQTCDQQNQLDPSAQHVSPCSGSKDKRASTSPAGAPRSRIPRSCRGRPDGCGPSEQGLLASILITNYCPDSVQIGCARGGIAVVDGGRVDPVHGLTVADRRS